MIRTLTWFVFFFAYQVYLLPALFRAGRLQKQGKTDALERFTAEVSVKWARRLLWLAGCRIQTEGLDRIPTDGAVLFTPNHQSNFDIPLLMASLGRPAGFIAKESLERFPLINRWMRLIHCVFIRRGNPREAAAAISAGIAELKQGHSMIVFPEGTRSLDGSLQEFKAGALKLATKARVPIVPVAIDGSIRMMQKGSIRIRPAVVRVTVLEPLMPDSYDNTDTTALSLMIQEAIQKQLKKD